MQDTTYTLAQTNRERKVAARSASHRVSGSKSRRCTLPSDHLTKAQRDALSGPVITYTMDARHTWSELRHWPEDLRRQYMDKLLSLNPSNAQLGELLSYSPARLWDPLQQCGIRRGRGGARAKQTEDQKARWDAIRGALPQQPETEPKPEPEPTPDPVITQTQPSMISSLTLDLPSVTMADALTQLLHAPLLQHLTDTYHITITIERRTNE